MLIRFDGRTAIVAGAARGIGQTIARSLANDGARVIACDLLVDDLAALAGRVDGGGEIIAAKVDVTNEASIAEVVRTAGGADILVYVAGGVRGQRPRPLEEVSADDFDAIVDANLKGAFLFIKARRAWHEKERHRTHCHHLEPRRPCHQPHRHPELSRRQARPDRSGQTACAGAWAVRHHREYGRARLHGDQP
jgi:NAD(P)-dependent dehydrogenase (short-subunit alcohol dehydrogenase family)